jgi:hypothetical protein
MPYTFSPVKKFLLTLILVVSLAGPAASYDDAEESAEFVFARVQFNMSLSALLEPEAPWHHDYPYAEDLYLSLVEEFTGVQTSPDSYEIVQLESPDIFKYPFLYFSEPGYMDMTPEEEENLRGYFNRGGFAMFDDFRGTDLNNLAGQMKRLFPDRELFPLTVRHRLFNSFYEIDTLDMVPLYGGFIGADGEFVVTDLRFTGGPEFWGMEDERGRLILVANQNNDLGEYWEGLDQATTSFDDAANAVRLGINYLIYAMTH